MSDAARAVGVQVDRQAGVVLPVVRPTASVTTRRGPRIERLDALRGLAAIMVMAHHTVYDGIWDMGPLRDVAYEGYRGVMVFFVLSGFLVALPFLRGPVGMRGYVVRRGARIVPAYVVALVGITLLSGDRQFLDDPPRFLLFLQNYDLGSFQRFLPVSWTLAIEVQFYVVLPLFAWAIGRFVGATRSRLRIVAGVLGVIAGALALRMVDEVVQGKLAIRHGVVGGLAKLFFHLTFGVQGKYLEVFGLGMLCSVLYLAAQEESRRLRRSLPWLGAALVAFAVVAMIGLAKVQMVQDILTPAYFMLTHATDMRVVGGPLLAGLPYAALTIGVLWAPRWLRAVFEIRPLRFIGLISYSLYLWHLPILYLAQRAATRLPQDARIWFMVVIGFTVAVPVAFLSYHFVERPFLARRS